MKFLRTDIEFKCDDRNIFKEMCKDFLVRFLEAKNEEEQLEVIRDIYEWGSDDGIHKCEIDNGLVG